MGFKKKGQVSFYFSFIIVALIVIVISAVLAPMGVLFNTRMYEAGEDILLQANASLSGINDPTVRAAIGNVTTEALDATVTNITVNSDIFQYGWILVIALAGIVIFIFTRRTIEYGGGGFV